MKIWETDDGTKQKSRDSIGRIQKDRGKIFHRHMMRYIDSLLEDAKRLCIDYGAVDTGALYSSIRLVTREFVPKESFVAGADATEEFMIVAGGPPYLNPKKGKFVDYALAVHDGYITSGGMVIPPRPFLSDSIAANKGMLDEIAKQYLRWIEDKWSGKK